MSEPFAAFCLGFLFGICLMAIVMSCLWPEKEEKE